jgi:hypothetical protein
MTLNPILQNPRCEKFAKGSQHCTRLLSLEMLLKLTKAAPEDGCMSPVRMPMVVVLPAPLGPRRPNT